MCMNSPNSVCDFQECLNRLVAWSHIWQLNISSKKCTILQVGNDSVDCTSHLGCEVITEVSVAKNLGISVDNLLKFNSYISQITARASARANLIHKCFVSKDIAGGAVAPALC